MQLAIDFHEESEALYTLLESIGQDDYDRITQFKDWTINHVIGHMHMGNRATELTLKDSADFQEFAASLIKSLSSGITLREFEDNQLDGLKGKALLDKWRELYMKLSEQFETVDPKMRVKWIGVDMSARSNLTARLMETWAHGQEVYDVLGVVRKEKNRIGNIVVLGMNTFGWSFMNRGMEVPQNKPYVKLKSPEGEIWEYNDPSNDSMIEGSAAQFCQVVTQVRNVGDTSLKIVGETADKWMSIAQCFAGPPENPPKTGSRYIAKIKTGTEKKTWTKD